jgi:hypothetical protein
MGTNEAIGLVLVSLGSILGVGVIIVKPILQVVRSMTALNESIKALTEKFKRFEVNNHDDHKRIWLHNEKQDEILAEHGTKLLLLEDKIKKGE